MKRTAKATPQKRPSLFLSDCDKYIARHLGDGANYEVWTRDGLTHWESDQRPHTFADVEAGIYPLPRQIGGYSATMNGQKKGTFTLHLLLCDATKKIKPWTGNTVLEKEEVTFRRKASFIPRWITNARRLKAPK